MKFVRHLEKLIVTAIMHNIQLPFVALAILQNDIETKSIWNRIVTINILKIRYNFYHTNKFNYKRLMPYKTIDVVCCTSQSRKMRGEAYWMSGEVKSMKDEG